MSFLLGDEVKMSANVQQPQLDNGAMQKYDNVLAKMRDVLQ